MNKNQIFILKIMSISLEFKKQQIKTPHYKFYNNILEAINSEYELYREFYFQRTFEQLPSTENIEDKITFLSSCDKFLFYDRGTYCGNEKIVWCTFHEYGDKIVVLNTLKT